MDPKSAEDSRMATSWFGSDFKIVLSGNCGCSWLLASAMWRRHHLLCCKDVVTPNLQDSYEPL